MQQLSVVDVRKTFLNLVIMFEKLYNVRLIVTRSLNIFKDMLISDLLAVERSQVSYLNNQTFKILTPYDLSPPFEEALNCDWHASDGNQLPIRHCVFVLFLPSKRLPRDHSYFKTHTLCSPIFVPAVGSLVLYIFTTCSHDWARSFILTRM